MTSNEPAVQEPKMKLWHVVKVFVLKLLIVFYQPQLIDPREHDRRHHKPQIFEIEGGTDRHLTCLLP